MGSPEVEPLERGLLMLGQGIEVLHRYGRKELGGEELTGVLRRVFEKGNRLEAARTALIVELDSLERGRPDGDRERSVPAGWSEMSV